MSSLVEVLSLKEITELERTTSELVASLTQREYLDSQVVTLNLEINKLRLQLTRLEISLAQNLKGKKRKQIELDIAVCKGKIETITGCEVEL